MFVVNEMIEKKKKDGVQWVSLKAEGGVGDALRSTHDALKRRAVRAEVTRALTQRVSGRPPSCRAQELARRRAPAAGPAIRVDVRSLPAGSRPARADRRVDVVAGASTGQATQAALTCLTNSGSL
ncbi:hypothetical protein O3P69_011728 [Scylla paramamosain]|uniref:Uncharacterized protein n=1 Tax=Scylla paramamosain TaxID=85552 RepID=A0AAW0SDJ4_SCYPA